MIHVYISEVKSEIRLKLETIVHGVNNQQE